MLRTVYKTEVGSNSDGFLAASLVVYWLPKMSDVVEALAE